MLTKRPTRHKRRWTEEEIDYLFDSYGYVPMYRLKAVLKRTDSAILQKALDLFGNTDVYYHNDLITTPELAEAIGVDKKTINLWIKDKDLPAKQLYRKAEKIRANRYFMEPAKVWNWLYVNREMINFSRYTEGVLPNEPEWLEKEIALSKFTKRPTNWTPEEDTKAFYWWQNGINYREIAKRLDRPEKGTQRRLTHLRKRKNEVHTKTS
jgi:hypothetical protein